MPKSNIYIYSYNNYFNKTFKRESTLADYGTPKHTLTDANFNYGDGVVTSHIVNYEGEGDYLIVTDAENNILHRWFIIDDNKTRGGQLRLNLRRDLRVDYYDLWKNADMIVHRGWPKYFNPIIFNPEGFSFNQIKQSEEFLRDDSLTPWYIIYFAKNCPTTTGTVSLSENYDFTINTPIDESVFANGSIYTCYDNRKIFSNSNQKTLVTSRVDWLKLLILGNNTFNDLVEERSARDRDYIWFDQNTATVRTQLTNAYYNKWSAWTADSYFGKTDGITGTNREQLEMGSFIIKDSTNALYQITITKNVNYGVESTTVTTTLSDAMKTAINATSLTREGDWGDEAFGIIYDETIYSVQASLITTGSVSWEIDFSNKQNTVDADYNIIAIPKQTIRIFTSDNDWHLVDENWSRALIESILSKVRNYIYDIQLLPYCPYPQNCTYDFSDTEYGTIYLYDYEYAPVRGLRSNQAYHNSSSDNHLFMLYVEKSQFEFNITKFYEPSDGHWWERNIDLKPQQYKQNGDIVNYKIDNECRTYRLCSPNYNGLFEFSVAKNDGVNQFNIDVTLRPQNPYIHINPNFKYMYGDDFNDARGLICQGDFSLPIVTDQWQTYEYQNKNYQNIFNRQMENLDFNQHQERVQAGWGIAGGAIGGGMSGAMTGFMASGMNPIGAAVGAGIGTASSLIGGIADYNMLTDRQEEQRDFAVDNYKYQLGNVKALSYSINKVTPLTNNNKIWPFIEIYDCTSAEKDILYKKLYYTSFTIEKIDTLSNYGEDGVLHFFQATPIRLDNAHMSTHEIDELAQEIEKGVYI